MKHRGGTLFAGLAIASLFPFSASCGSDSNAGGSGGSSGFAGSSPRGDPVAGKVGCAGDSCDVTQGQKCCLWMQGSPLKNAHACLADCAQATPAPGLGVEEIDCDGSEDCTSGVCCDGKCTTDTACKPGVSEYCHHSADCPSGVACCALQTVGAAHYGSCIVPEASGCTWD